MYRGFTLKSLLFIVFLISLILLSGNTPEGREKINEEENQKDKKKSSFEYEEVKRRDLKTYGQEIDSDKKIEIPIENLKKSVILRHQKKEVIDRIKRLYEQFSICYKIFPFKSTDFTIRFDPDGFVKSLKFPDDKESGFKKCIESKVNLQKHERIILEPAIFAKNQVELRK